MPGLSFLSPLFLIGAAAAIIPIAIHLFRRRTEPVIRFAAMRYLRQAPVEHSRVRRLRELLLLAMRAAALLLLALAFARPYFTDAGAQSAGPGTVVMIDTSASLSAPGQFDRARELARDAIRSAPPAHAVGVVAFAGTVDEIAPLAANRAGALAAVGQLRRGEGATRYAPALARAEEMLGGRGGQIVVVTDLQETGWEAASPAGVSDRVAITLRAVDAPQSNLAVTSLRVDGRDAVAVVRNFSAGEAGPRVEFTLDGKPVGSVQIAVAAHGTAEARVALPAQEGALAASVPDADGYAADNVRYAVVDANESPAVLAVSASGHPSEVFYLERALSIGRGANGFRFRAVGGPSFSDLTPGELDAIDVIAIVGTRGLEQRGRELLAAYVRRGGGVLVAAGPDVDPQIVGVALNGLLQTTWRARDAGRLAFAPDDGRHPVFRPFGGVGTLGNVTFTRAAAVETGDGAEVVARYSDGSPALVEERAGEGRILVFASDLNDQWNDFPLQPAFVPFVHEALRYLGSPRPRRNEYLVGDLPGAAASAPGVVDLPFGGASGARAVRRVAVNVDSRESDPAALTPDAFTGRISRLNALATRRAAADARDREDKQRLWQAVVLLMIVGLVAEGLLGRRLG